MGDVGVRTHFKVAYRFPQAQDYWFKADQIGG